MTPEQWNLPIMLGLLVLYGAGVYVVLIYHWLSRVLLAAMVVLIAVSCLATWVCAFLYLTDCARFGALPIAMECRHDP